MGVRPDVSQSYVVYLKNGGTTSLNLIGVAGTFDVRWFDPRNGGALQNGSVTQVSGGSTVSLGNAPASATGDWVILIQLPVAEPPILEYGKTGGEMVFDWAGEGFKMQSRTNLMEGLWLDMGGGGTPPVSVVATHPEAFFRLIEQ